MKRFLHARADADKPGRQPQRTEMRITILTLGARGDTEPFIALALRLQSQGHSVRVAARPDVKDLVQDYGIGFVPLGNPYRPFIAGAAKANAMGSGHPVSKLRYGLSQRSYVTEGLHDDAWKAAQGADTVVFKYPWISGYTIAEKLGVPCVPVMLLPLTPTRAFPSFMTGRAIDRGPLLNQLVWHLPWEAVWQGLRWDDKKLRRQLGLPMLPFRGALPAERHGMPILCAWSPAVLPPSDDWPANRRVTGYWFLDPPPGWQPSGELVDFLQTGPPPVSIGFGSMVSRDSAATLKIVLGALKLAGLRAVLLSGWSEIGAGSDLPATVFSAPGIPHGWLFPRMAAVVHHGGAGTTGAGLRAGIPSVICPHLADQPSWARLVHDLGAGPAPIPFRDLTASRLAQALRDATTDPVIRQRAAALGSKIRSEDGAGRAAAAILRYALTFQPSSPQ
jgi:sterol 3beta-glucosyltransferase